MSDFRAERMASLYHDEELTLQEIGDLYGITRERVRQLLVEAGRPSQRSIANARVTRRAAAAAAAQRAEIVTLYRRGRTAAEIARELPGVSRATAISLLRREISEPERRRIIGEKIRARNAPRETRDQMIANLRAAAAEMGPGFRMKDFADWARERGALGPQTYLNRFGTWAAARDLAGLSTLRRGSHPRSDQISSEECLTAVREVTARLGHLPSSGEYARAAARNGLPSLTTIIKRFGRWSETLARVDGN